jgi:hypothetical protein
MVGDCDAILQQVAQWTQEMGRFMAHVDAARGATLAAITLAPTAAVLWRPAVNVFETAEAVVVQAELASVAPNDMTIQYDDGLCLSGGNGGRRSPQRPKPSTACRRQSPWRARNVSKASQPQGRGRFIWRVSILNRL